MLISIEFFLTIGLEITKKTALYWCIIAPIVLVTIIVGQLTTVHLSFFFLVVFILTLVGIYQVILHVNHELVNDILTAEGLYRKTNEKNLNLEESQKKIKHVYEEMSRQKFELEQAYKKLDKVSSEIYIQNELLKYISQTLDIEQLLDLVTDSVIGAVGTDTCSLLIYNDKDRNEYFVESKSTTDPDATKHLMALIDAGEMDQYMELKEPMVDEDGTKDEYVFSSNRLIGSLIFMPLIRDEEVYGILYAEHHQKDYFKESTLDFFGAIATQINIAVNNANLYSKMEEIAKIDALTQLYNRRTFQDKLETLYSDYKEANKRFSVKGRVYR